jgi:signal transduction histidine kinase
MHNRWLLVLSVTSLVVVAVLDLYRWPNHNLAILYTIPVLLASFVESAALVLVMSAAVVLLDSISLMISQPPNGELRLTIIALMIVCYLALRVAGQRALIRQEVEASLRASWNQALLAEVAHELRTPLTVVLARAQLLRRDPALPGPLHEPVALIEKSALRMREALDDLAQRWKSGGGSRS